MSSRNCFMKLRSLTDIFYDLDKVVRISEKKYKVTVQHQILQTWLKIPAHGQMKGCWLRYTSIVVQNMGLLSLLFMKNMKDHKHTTCLNCSQKLLHMYAWQKGVRPGSEPVCFNIKTVFPCMGIPMLKIRWLQNRLIFNMGIPILVRWHLYIEITPLCEY